jgi:hypothetical protein
MGHADDEFGLKNLPRRQRLKGAPPDLWLRCGTHGRRGKWEKDQTAPPSLPAQAACRCSMARTPRRCPRRCPCRCPRRTLHQFQTSRHLLLLSRPSNKPRRLTASRRAPRLRLRRARGRARSLSRFRRCVFVAVRGGRGIPRPSLNDTLPSPSLVALANVQPPTPRRPRSAPPRRPRTTRSWTGGRARCREPTSMRWQRPCANLHRPTLTGRKVGVDINHHHFNHHSPRATFTNGLCHASVSSLPCRADQQTCSASASCEGRRRTLLQGSPLFVSGSITFSVESADELAAAKRAQDDLARKLADDGYAVEKSTTEGTIVVTNPALATCAFKGTYQLVSDARKACPAKKSGEFAGLSKCLDFTLFMFTCSSIYTIQVSSCFLNYISRL